TPEFDAWRWNAYWVPLDAVIEFKREVYSMALNELSGLLFRKGRENRYLRHRGPRATGQHDDSAGRASDAPAVQIPRPQQVSSNSSRGAPRRPQSRFDRMLQVLDALSRRIRQVVQLAQSLQCERATLQARVRQLEQECQALKDQQLREGQEFARMSERLARHDQELQNVRDEAGQHRAALESQVRDHQIRTDSLQRRLAQVESERDRLREAASGAQQQIELILERLPGAEA